MLYKIKCRCVTLRFGSQSMQRINNPSEHRARDKHVTPAACQKNLIKYYIDEARYMYPILDSA